VLLPCRGRTRRLKLLHEAMEWKVGGWRPRVGDEVGMADHQELYIADIAHHMQLVSHDSIGMELETDCEYTNAQHRHQRQAVKVKAPFRKQEKQGIHRTRKPQ
jgi:hypothetical protein